MWLVSVSHVGFWECPSYPGSQKKALRSCCYLDLGEGDRIPKHKPLDVLCAGRSGERAVVGVIVSDVLRQQIPDVNIFQGCRLS